MLDIPRPPIFRLALAALVLATTSASARSPEPKLRVQIPPIEVAPTLDDFLDMQPSPSLAGRMAHVSGLIQRSPEDGEPASQKTDAFLAYDGTMLYVAFVCFDDEPDRIRANLARRGTVFGDEIVEIMLDTFGDAQRAYAFVANPLGVQWDAIWTEGSGFDDSWDTIWHSEGRLTDRGYVVLMSIPFKSLRFSPETDQTWGMILVRDIPRNDESSFWPEISSRIEGRLGRAAALDGLSGISPGRNLQIIPYVSAARFRALDTEEARFERDSFDPDGGVDVKWVLDDRVALDVTVNPDFSQVESDNPQVTVNERFPVFFPEKRPFFLENSGFFSTPFNLLFTRRIEEPRVGARMTGKLGAYALGTLVIDDEAPGRDLAGSERARFGILRVRRDLPRQSNVGAMYTERSFGDRRNRVAGVDGRIKFDDTWDLTLQTVISRTEENADDPARTAAAHDIVLNRNGRSLNTHAHYQQIGRDFDTDVGFVPRTDLRNLHGRLQYTFWPEGPKLISWAPSFFVERIWDEDKVRLDERATVEFEWDFRRNTSFEVEASKGRERLRPIDIRGNAGNLLTDESLDFDVGEWSVEAGTRFSRRFSASLQLTERETISVVPPAGELPRAADQWRVNGDLTWRPGKHLRMEMDYIWTRLDDQASGEKILTNRLGRLFANWQFDSEWALRLILQYDRTDPNPGQTDLEHREEITADLLASYVINPWTAAYLGYTSGYENLDIVDGNGGPGLRRTRDDYLNDARQVFFKFSYSFRP